MRRVQTFLRELAARAVDPAGRRWVYVPYDQLTDALGPLAHAAPGELGVVLIESPAKAARRPYHRQKLALVLANQRHFALEQAARGVAVRYVVARDGYAPALAALAKELGPLAMMEAAERELRVEIAPLVDRGALRVEPHEAGSPRARTSTPAQAARRRGAWIRSTATCARAPAS
jgi:deoxyribodipyrimidine photolyase-related protein